MSKGFVRGMLQLVFWPLFRPSRWRAAMAELDLAPGLALTDLSMRRRDHRRLAAQVWALWLGAIAWNAICRTWPISIGLGGTAEMGTAVLAFLAMLAIGGSVPGAIALLSLWQVLTVVLPLSANNIYGMKALPMAPVIIVAGIAVFGLGGIRYRRNASVVRHLVSLLSAPFLMIAAWIPTLTAGSALRVGLSLAVTPGLLGATDAWEMIFYELQTFEFYFLGLCFSFPVILVLLVVPLARDLVDRVIARRTRD